MCVGTLVQILEKCWKLFLEKRSDISDVLMFQSGRIGAEEVINDDDGRDAEELDELIKEKEAKTQAILLEMVSFQHAAAKSLIS